MEFAASKILIRGFFFLLIVLGYFYLRPKISEGNAKLLKYIFIAYLIGAFIYLIGSDI